MDSCLKKLQSHWAMIDDHSTMLPSSIPFYTYRGPSLLSVKGLWGSRGELLPLTYEEPEDQKQKWFAQGLVASWCLRRFILPTLPDLLLPPLDMCL